MVAGKVRDQGEAERCGESRFRVSRLLRDSREDTGEGEIGSNLPGVDRQC